MKSLICVAVVEGGVSQEGGQPGAPRLVGDGCLDPVLALLKQAKQKTQANWQVSHLYPLACPINDLLFVLFFK